MRVDGGPERGSERDGVGGREERARECEREKLERALRKAAQI
jgi:hypothetical protein